MKSLNFIIPLLAFLFLLSCNQYEKTNTNVYPKGKLFIIGGGKRPDYMVKEMIKLSGADTSGYIIVLPMASSEPDTSAWYAEKQFRNQGADSIITINIQDPENCGKECIKRIEKASMIYITGGVQQKLMDIILGTSVHRAIIKAFYDGALIAGTSAGAAVMSKKMITGNEYKHPEYTGDFRTIEAENMEITEGLGLLKSAIVDQHFVRRMRMNRLISVALENPGYMCIGIDESTALIIDKDHGRAFGESQIILLKFDGESYTNNKGLIGGRGLRLDVLLPGELFDYEFFNEDIIPGN